MELNFISSQILLPFDYNKHFGMFVYLMNKYDKYEKGLYFGGISGWERLTNDISSSSKTVVNPPIASDNIYYYNGLTQNYLPKNWENISAYCYLFGNNATDAGVYNVEVYLNDASNMQWADTGLSSVKILEWIINPYKINNDNIYATLNKYEMTYEDEEPYVTSVICNTVFNESGSLIQRALVKDLEYAVEKPTDFKVGNKSFKVKLCGNFAHNYTCDEIDLGFVVNKKRIDLPTNLNQSVIYDSDNVITYSPKPDNWEEIKKYCTITENEVSKVGSYTYIISLKDTDNYCWNNEGLTSNPQELIFNILVEGVALPDWKDIENTYEYSIDYRTNPIVLYPTNWDDIKDDTIISTPSAILPNIYDVNISLKDTNNSNWVDNTTEVKIFKFTITAKSIDIPTDNSTLYTYNGTEQTWEPGNWNEIKNYCNIINNKKIDAGTYDVTISLNDKEGYVWTTGGNEDKKITWSINTFNGATASLEPNGTDLINPSDGHYVMTYNPTNHPTVKVTSINGNVLTEGTDYDVMYPENYNAGNKEYVITLKGNYTGTITLYLTINKANGYFTSGPSIDGTLRVGNTITANAVPVSGGEMTYTWYSNGRPFASESSGGYIEEITSKSIDLTRDYIDYYWRVVISVAETENYNSFVGYAKADTPVGKPKIEFKFIDNKNNDIDNATVVLTAGTYTLPNTTKPSDDNGTITYTVSDSTIGSMIGTTNKVQLNALGEVTITATITGSMLYDYEPNTDTFTLKIVDEAPIYWGFTPYWSYDINDFSEGERLKYTLQSGDLPSNKILAEMTDNGDGTKSFEVSASDYYNNYYLIDSVKYPKPCSAWWFALPKDTTIVSALENGHSPWSGQEMIYYFRLNDSDVNNEGTSDTFVVNVDGVDYYVFTSIDSLVAYVSEYTTSFVFKITIK